MPRNNIKIFVVNREKKADEKNYRGLDSHIKALAVHGYSVQEDIIPPSNIGDYDIIVAHPGYEYFVVLRNLHEKHPEIPLIFYSRMGIGERDACSGFGIDSDGTYYSYNSTMKDFLNLIKKLSGNVYRKKNMCLEELGSEG
jgi:hypothetical protein